MTTPPPRSYTGLAIAIIVAALIIGSVAYLTISPTGKTVTLTTTMPTTLTTTVPTTRTTTLSTTVTSTLTTSCDTSTTLHCVVFQQLGACSAEFWGIPWSVTIGVDTEVQPPGTTLPLNNYGLIGTLNKNFTVIIFSLPNGVYPFSVSPSVGFFTPTAGSVTVNGTDALVEIAYTGTSCTSTSGSPAGASTATVNGSAYYADNITGDISVGNPGFSYFLNGSVTFMGVKFATICLPIYGGCPVPPGTTVTNQETVAIGAISLSATFPDKTNETVGGVIGDITYFFVLSHHASPQAGILIVYTSSGYKSYLLVS